MIKIRGYLGIDESNHGRVPEIYVGVFSYIDLDLHEGKHKKRRNSTIGEILGNSGRAYKHLLLTKEHKEIFGDHGIKIIAIGELIKTFYKEFELRKILIDGEVREIDKINLERIIYPIKTSINFQAKSDITFPIVNKADGIANILYKYYSRLNRWQEGRKYEHTKVSIKVKDYINLVNLFE